MPSPQSLTSPSRLISKIQSMGISNEIEIIALAVARGCRHYTAFASGVKVDPTRHTCISNEELAIALLHPFQSHRTDVMRVGAQMLSAPDCDPATLVRLAEEEGCSDFLRYIAECGQRTEPANPFWRELVGQLQNAPFPVEASPHISRFRLEVGIMNPRLKNVPKIQWLRPGM